MQPCCSGPLSWQPHNPPSNSHMAGELATPPSAIAPLSIIGPPSTFGWSLPRRAAPSSRSQKHKPHCFGAGLSTPPPSPECSCVSIPAVLFFDHQYRNDGGNDTDKSGSPHSLVFCENSVAFWTKHTRASKSRGIWLHAHPPYECATWVTCRSIIVIINYGI